MHRGSHSRHVVDIHAHASLRPCHQVIQFGRYQPTWPLPDCWDLCLSVKWITQSLDCVDLCICPNTQDHIHFDIFTQKRLFLTLLLWRTTSRDKIVSFFLWCTVHHTLNMPSWMLRMLMTDSNFNKQNYNGNPGTSLEHLSLDSMNNTHRVMCQVCVTVIAVVSADQHTVTITFSLCQQLSS